MDRVWFDVPALPVWVVEEDWSGVYIYQWDIDSTCYVFCCGFVSIYLSFFNRIWYNIQLIYLIQLYDNKVLIRQSSCSNHTINTSIPIQNNRYNCFNKKSKSVKQELLAFNSSKKKLKKSADQLTTLHQLQNSKTKVQASAKKKGRGW